MGQVKAQSGPWTTWPWMCHMPPGGARGQGMHSGMEGWSGGLPEGSGA